MPHHHKLKITSSSQQQQLKQKFLAMPQVAWVFKAEQNCLYRLDGQQVTGKQAETAQWLRVKQFTNGTLYLEANTEADLALLTGVLSGALLPEQRPQGTVIQTPSSAAAITSVIKTPDIGPPYIGPPYIGTDESGKGDYFGPLVTAGVLLKTTQEEAALKRLGVTDSKKLNAAQITRLSQEILQMLGPEQTAVICWLPADYNVRYQAIKSQGQNLNHLLAQGHAQAIAQLLKALPTCPTLVVDRFSAQDQCMSQALAGIAMSAQRLIQLPRAEAYTAVAAASILARQGFVQAMAQLSTQYGMDFPLGATHVKPAARVFLQQYGPQRLAEVAKVHFQITGQITD